MISTHARPRDLSIWFVLHEDAPPRVRQKWAQLRALLHSHAEDSLPTMQHKQKKVISDWLCHCELETNRGLPFLDRLECGIGRNNNWTSKQIRFIRSKYSLQTTDKAIVIDQILNSGDEISETWDHSELVDLIQAFCHSASGFVGAYTDCVSGYIRVHV
jgi:hypothetical protein